MCACVGSVTDFGVIHIIAVCQDFKDNQWYYFCDMWARKLSSDEVKMMFMSDAEAKKLPSYKRYCNPVMLATSLLYRLCDHKRNVNDVPVDAIPKEALANAKENNTRFVKERADYLKKKMSGQLDFWQ